MQLELFKSAEGHTIIETEEWKDLAQFPRYEVSNMGRFRRRIDGKIAKGSPAFNGYIHIGLRKDGRQITKLAHRLVAETWLLKPSPSHSDVNHKNKVRNDNRVSNLEWSTRSHNARHAKAK